MFDANVQYSIIPGEIPLLSQDFTGQAIVDHRSTIPKFLNS